MALAAPVVDAPDVSSIMEQARARSNSLSQAAWAQLEQSNSMNALARQQASAPPPGAATGAEGYAPGMAAWNGPATGSSGGSGGGGSTGGGGGSGNRDEFIQNMMPHALRVSQQTGVDPRLIIAQSAQETGWGRSAPNNNYFGIKSHGQGGGSTMATNEVINGQTVRISDSFRGYGDMGASVDDYGRFLTSNPRYQGMLSASGLDGQLAALGKSGYATDPNYAASVGNIARSIQIPQPQQQAPRSMSQQMAGYGMSY